MKHLPGILLALGLSTMSPAFARDLSLSDALALAREHSRELQRAEAEREAAQAVVGTARAARFPTLAATATAFYNTDIAALTIPLTGATITRELGTKANYQTDLRLSIPLFTGGRISGGIGAAMASEVYRRALVDAQEDQVYYLARLEYLNVYRGERQVQAAEQSLRRVRVIRQSVASLYEAGAADSVAILEVALAVNEARFRLEQAMHDHRAAEIRLAQVLGLPAGESFNLTTRAPEPSLPDEIVAGSERPELRAASAALAISRAEVTQARAGWWPSLAAYGGYSYGMPNLDRFNNTWNDFWQVGARLDWSFNLGFETRHRVNRSHHAARAVEHQRENVREDLDEQRLIAWENLKLAFEQYQTARDRYRITSSNYRLAESQHREGALTSNRLVEIEATLSEAEAAVAAAEAGFYIAQSAYFYATGSDKLTEGF